MRIERGGKRKGDRQRGREGGGGGETERERGRELENRWTDLSTNLGL